MANQQRAGLDFLVDKKNWADCRFEERDAPADLADGEVLFRVERFAFTSNNITYAAMGDILAYWQFFLAENGLGRIPAMGFGEVVQSKHPDVAVETRCFGFYPMSRYLVIQPSVVTDTRIVDGAEHRAEISPTYNEYTLTTGDGRYHPDFEDEQLLLSGLFLTSFLDEDYLLDNDFYGAEQIIISSASSKTAIALGHVCKARGRIKTVGLTSERNLDFTRGLDYYDEVRLYDEVTDLDPGKTSVYVDFAGSDAVKQAVHNHFGTNLKLSQIVGATHWDAGGSGAPLPGPKPEMFFAPGQIQKRMKEWGPEGFQERMGASWENFRAGTAKWLTVRRGFGRKTVEETYRTMLAGKSSPADGHVISLWDDEAASTGG